MSLQHEMRLPLLVRHRGHSIDMLKSTIPATEDNVKKVHLLRAGRSSRSSESPASGADAKI